MKVNLAKRESIFLEPWIPKKIAVKAAWQRFSLWCPSSSSHWQFQLLYFSSWNKSRSEMKIWQFVMIIFIHFIFLRNTREQSSSGLERSRRAEQSGQVSSSSTHVSTTLSSSTSEQSPLMYLHRRSWPRTQLPCLLMPLSTSRCSILWNLWSTLPTPPNQQDCLLPPL